MFDLRLKYVPGQQWHCASSAIFTLVSDPSCGASQPQPLPWTEDSLEQWFSNISDQNQNREQFTNLSGTYMNYIYIYIYI